MPSREGMEVEEHKDVCVCVCVNTYMYTYSASTKLVSTRVGLTKLSCSHEVSETGGRSMRSVERVEEHGIHGAEVAQ